MDQLNSIVPIFKDRNGERFSQEGSGVLIEFREHVFLLTAGHIIDQLETADLLIPNLDNEILSIEGTHAYNKPSGKRGADFLDFGYFKLDQDFAEALRESFYFIKENEFGIEDEYADKELFSFAGYPHRKSNVAGGIAKTDFFAYGTYHADATDYHRFGFYKDANIVTKFNRKNSFNPKAGRVETPVLPHGISGGGAFIWPKNELEIPPRNRKLVGIIHEWRKEGYFIATRLEIILTAILKNNPDLRDTRSESQSTRAHT
ncbi:MAG: hypothetical protein P1U80_04720 [Pseudomonadales bacterium]|nr:hypothetical protein [Pseudomonadales bacterium]